MATYGNDQNGLWVKFTDISSDTVKQIEYINGVLYVTQAAGWYYTFNFASLTKARMIFSDTVEKQVLFVDATNGLTASTTGNEWIVGTNTNDVINSRAGNDRLFGGAGDDTYQFTKGDGTDTVTDFSGNNTIQFTDSKQTDLTIQGNGTKLEVKYSATDSVLVDGNVNNYKFSDGTTQTQDQLLTGKAITLTGTAAAETINGFASNDTINAGDGNDTLNGNAGNDTLNGGNGDDRLNGGDGSDVLNGDSGNDTLDGGIGNDAVNGGIGNDTLNGSDGNDTLNGGVGDDNLYAGNGDDTILLSRGSGNDAYQDTTGNNKVIFSDIKSTEVTGIDATNMTLGGLIIRYGTTDSLYIKYATYSGNATPTSYQFSDGVTLTHDQLLARFTVNFVGTDLSDSFYGTTTKDVMNGGLGDDYLYGRSGNDVQNGGAGNDGIYGDAGDDLLIGGLGNDTLSGGAGNDSYQFTKGDGADTVSDNSGTNNLRFMNSTVSEITVDGAGTNGFRINYGTGDSVTVNNTAATYSFSDGQTLTQDQLLVGRNLTLTGTANGESLSGFASNDTLNAGDGNDSLNGNAGNDTLNGGNGNDNLYGGDGDDLSVGGQGNDWLQSGNGNDVYQFSKGDGQDTVNDYSGSNTIRLVDSVASDINLTVNGANELVINYSNTDSVTLKAYVNNYVLADGIVQTSNEFLTGKTVTWTGTEGANTFSGYVANDLMNGGDGDDTLNGNDGNDTLNGELGNDKLNGGNGIDTLSGGLGDDTLNGNDGDDILNGGLGNDVLNGNAGDDVYRFAKGDGVDTINWDFSGNNSIVFSDIKSTDVQYSFDKGTLNIQYSDADTVKISNFLSENRANFSIQFADGVTIDRANLDTTVGVNYWIKSLIASTHTNADFKYLFPTSAPDYLNASEKAGWSAFSQAQKDFLVQVFQKTSEFSALTFTETDNANQLNTIAAQRNSNADTAYAYFPGGGYSNSDIYFGPDFWFDPAGQWVASSYPHELGHAMGLMHTFEGPTIGSFSAEEDSRKWSVMSYNRTGMAYDGSYAAFDIAALQAMYGINSTSRAGNDSYKFDSTIGTLAWDGAGTDTIDGSTAAQAATIDLREGGWSYLGVKSDHISTADQLTINLGTKIENAIGSAYNDTLIGNGLANRLEGGAGNDSLSGAWGNDTLLGGAGNDVLDGGKGSDSMAGGLGDDTYYVNDAGDTVVENLSEGNDNVISDISYTLGDNLEGLTLNGIDHLNGTGNALNNVLTGNAGNNILSGLAGNDTLTGNAGNDTLDGGAGNDRLDGGSGADTLIGGLGDDVYFVDDINDVIVEKINEGFETVNSTVSFALDSGNALNYLTLLGTANINGVGNVNDNLILGNDGDNTLEGKNGNDTLRGGLGNDSLNGGAGNDTLTGGTGSDTAIYNLLTASDKTGGNGIDTWTDFKVGNTATDNNADKIDISDLLINYAGGDSVSSLVSYISLGMSGTNSVISIDRDGSGSTYTSTTLLTLNSVNTNLNTLWDNHQLVVV